MQRNALEVVSMPAMSNVPQMVAPLGLAVPERSPVRISEPKHKGSVLDSARSTMGGLVKKRAKPPIAGGGNIHAHVNIDRLDLASLRRYRRVFNLNISKDCTRDELVFAVRKHFAKIKVDEKEVIVNFARRMSRRGAQTTTCSATTRPIASDKAAAKYA